MTSADSPSRRLALLRGSGRTGRLVLERALEDGWSVRALVRGPAKLDVEHPRLDVVEGDVLDPAAVAQTIRDSDAVVSVIGRTKGTKGPMMGPAARNIVAAMREAGVSRLVATTGAGVRATADEPKLVDKAIVGLMKVIAREELEDGNDYVHTIHESDLDWTVVRAPRLDDGPPADGDLYVGPVSAEWARSSRGRTSPATRSRRWSRAGTCARCRW